MFHEVMGFDEDLLAFLPQPTFGIVANLEMLKKQEDLERGSPDTQTHFYMKQHKSLDNACGIVAALHALMNNPSDIVYQEGSILQEFQMNSLG